MQHIESYAMSPLLNSRNNTPPFFLLIFQKFVAVKNKYSVLGLPGNKFSDRAHDENK